MAEYEQGLRLAPDNVTCWVRPRCTDASLGRWDGVVSRLARASRSIRAPPTRRAGWRRCTLFLRQYAAADSAADRAVALAPTNPGWSRSR